MPLRNDISAQKRHGAVYTPKWIADFILAETAPGKLAGKTLCDPACGDGNFLLAAAERIAAETKSKKSRAAALQNLYGFDRDGAALQKCKKRLDDFAAAHCPGVNMRWNLRRMDSMDARNIAPYKNYFDIVAGNPPYIRIQHMEKSMRARIARQWPLAARGCSDVYMAFFQLGLTLLGDNGKLGFITPNGYAKTDAGAPLREFLAKNNLVETLADFGEHQVFSGATAYALITVLNKKQGGRFFNLHRYDGKKFSAAVKTERSRLLAPRWDLCGRQEYRRLNEIRGRGTPLHAIADISVGVQTLADDVFILENTGGADGVLLCKTADGVFVELEEAATIPILKVSVMKNGEDRKRRVIIRPYKRTDKPALLSEEELRARFPKTHAYLSLRKKRLLMRDKGACRAEWFAYGRAINLQKTLGAKILTAAMNPSPNFMKCPDARCTFYAGYAVKIKNNAIGEDELLAQLNSADMDFFIRRTGRDYRNGWKSYAKAFIRNFGVLGARSALEF